MRKKLCDYWNNKATWETIADLVVSFGTDRTTTTKHLNIGNEVGWCNYDGQEERRKTSYLNGKNNGKPVEVFKDGISLGVFESATELERVSEGLFGFKLGNSAISSVCVGRKNKYKGLTFKRK